ncbi:hypothetical protein GDO86_020572 [Hymenochirus boettgeri]|uniref:Kinesin motor domain-containing protein n=1 Tax=Hymenochirus boettgeri TaxID=247094 RepID=A0A8T2IKM1_9PIPI|nr:hypothetical protein GDO86_020572 [Hymenochirus boettgeri]
MKQVEDHRLPPRPSYLGEGINYLEREEPQPVDDIKTNLSEQFSLLRDTESELNEKNVLESKENMQVYLRVRPFSALEVEQQESQDCVTIPDSCTVLVKPPLISNISRLSEKVNGSVAQKFTFTRVFGPDTSQIHFFEGTIKQHVTDFLKGQNRLIFTYGVTNAGKTFTFQGTKDNVGILPRSMDMLFNSIQGRVYSKRDIKPHRCRDYVRLTKEQVKTETALKNSVLRQMKEVDCSLRSNNSRTGTDTMDLIIEEGLSNSSSMLSETDDHLKQSEEFRLPLDNSVKYSVWISFCEIYNESIYDLLDPISGDKFYKRKTLRLALDLKGFSFVKDLQWIEVSDAKEACKILALGKKFQSIAYTKLNSSSSRSHSIFTVRLLKITDGHEPRVLKVSELSLCDLAGSERCTKTQNEGDRLKESGNINTSLLTLGKCINALKTSQHSKVHQHVPFRESKLTHYLQSFFSGKGKVCMIVNICQSASAYDETLNVLKFSAVAQKVLILESCQNSEIFDQKRKSREVSFIINNADKKIWTSRKRATVQWDLQLEDVVEDEDNEEPEEDLEEDEEYLDCTYQDEEEGVNEDEIVIKKDSYQKLLDLVEDLKTKLLNKNKDKLLMELKIRKEVAQEFTEHFMQRENDFSEDLQKERELMEERCDERLEIFQDLVKKCSETLNEGDEAQSTDAGTAKVDDSIMPIDDLFISMQNDLAAIKKQAVEAHLHITSIPDFPDIISKMEQKLKQISSDLSRTQEELKRKSFELEIQVEKCSKTVIHLEEANKKLSSQKKQIDQLVNMTEQKESVIEKLKDLVAHWEAKCEDYEKTVNGIKGEMVKASSNAVGRKRRPEDPQCAEEEPPSKKEFAGVTDAHSPTALKQMDVCNNIKEPNLQKEMNDLKAEAEHSLKQITNLTQTISMLEEKLAQSDEQLNEMKSKNQSLISELQIHKDLTNTLEEKVKMLIQEENQNKLNIASKVAKIRTFQSKLNEIGSTVEKQGNSENQTDYLSANEHDLQKEDADSTRKSTFYSAIDDLWKKCQEILQESTKKTQLIQELEKNLENVNNDVISVKSEKECLQMKLNETTAQVTTMKEKEDLIVHLRNLLSEKNNMLEAHKMQESVNENEIKGLKNQVNAYTHQIKDLESLLTSYKDKCEMMKGLEEQNKAKASDTLRLEQLLEEARIKHEAYDKDLTALMEEKKKLQEKAIELEEKFGTLGTADKYKEKQVEKLTEDVALLKKDLSLQTSELKSLQLDLQRKEEDCTELKEKLMDSKKQIQQVEKEISSLREEKRLLTSKVGEFEKLKNQMTRDLEMKQRTIQQLKKEPINQEKHGDTMLLYQKTCQDVQEKEKIIEGMRAALLEQEQTQEEQDEVLEAKEKELETLSQELKQWKHRYRELGMEFEEKYNSERKKWLEDKMGLLAQAKESETHRNKEMRKFAEDREHYSKQQTEMEQLAAQLAEKEQTLQEWRKERDQLLSALEIQLKNLLSSNMEKDKEIEALKNCSNLKTQEVLVISEVAELRKLLTLREETIKELQQNLANVDHSKSLPINVVTTNQEKEKQTKSSVNQLPSITEHSIGSLSSTDDCQEAVKSENKKNTITRLGVKTPSSHASPTINNSETKKGQRYTLKKQPSVSSTNSTSSRKKDGTLQRIGDLLQSSPSIFQSKAKKLLETIAVPKAVDLGVCKKENEIKPKRSRRKLYTSDISEPLDIPAHSIVLDTNEKESDHLIMKRRLRTRTAK